MPKDVILIRGPGGRLIHSKPRRQPRVVEPEPPAPARKAPVPESAIHPKTPFKQERIPQPKYPLEPSTGPKITASGSFLPKKGTALIIPDPEIPGGDIAITSAGRGHRIKQPTAEEREAMNLEAIRLDEQMHRSLREKAKKKK